MIARAARNAIGAIVFASPALSDEYFDLGTNAGAVFLFGNVILQPSQPLIALLYHLGWDLVIHGRSRGAGPRGVLEGVGHRKAGFFDDGHGVLEVFLSFSREADNNVGGDGGVGNALADAIEDAQVLL